MTLEATATLPSGPRAVKSLNDPTDVGANGIAAYTPLWGTYSRARGVQGATDVAEVVVTDGKVASVNPTAAGSGPLPANSFALVGREQGAAALRALQVGDAVTLAYDLKSDIADDARLRGRRRARSWSRTASRSPSPWSAPTARRRARRSASRTAGRRCCSSPPTAASRSSSARRARQMGVLMADLGVETALNLDGGGSTTMVARPLGNPLATVRNLPSDGSERSDPNGVGVFVAPGDGTVHDLAIDGAPKVFPGLHRTFGAAGVDDHDTPVAADVSWRSDAGARAARC